MNTKSRNKMYITIRSFILFDYICLQTPFLSPLESTLGGNTLECKRLPMNSSGSEAGDILTILQITENH